MILLLNNYILYFCIKNITKVKVYEENYVVYAQCVNTIFFICIFYESL